MPQPRKYKTDAERQSAYRERKRERDEEIHRELDRLKPAAAGSAKRNATFTSDDALRQGLRELRQEMIKRRRKAKRREQLVELLDYLQSGLDYLARPPKVLKEGFLSPLRAPASWRAWNQNTQNSKGRRKKRLIGLGA